MFRRSLGLLILSALWAPSLCSAVTSASKDYDDQGLALFNKGLYSKSIEYFQHAVQADSTNWQAYEDLGNAYSQLGQNQNAIDAYQNSLRTNPKNQTVRDAIKDLGGEPTAAPGAPTSGSKDTGMTPMLPKNTKVYPAPEDSVNDNLPRMDHARVWTRFELGYNYSAQSDLFSSATTINGIVGSSGFTGLAKADNNGYMAGAEVGFLLNPNIGLALGLRYMNCNSYTSNIDLQNGGDFEDESFHPYLLPVTADLYLFLPDSGGRFFLSGGVGYYASMVHVDDNYDFSISQGSGTYDTFNGDLYGGAVGFQVTVGRDIVLSDRWGLEIFARGRYARITNYRGTVESDYGGQADAALIRYSDGEVHTGNVSGMGPSDSFATLDFTGFDAGVGLTFF